MLNLIGNVYNLTGMQIVMWNKIKKFLFTPSKRDKERVERWRELTSSDDMTAKIQSVKKKYPKP